MRAETQTHLTTHMPVLFMTQPRRKGKKKTPCIRIDVNIVITIPRLCTNKLFF